MGYDPYAGQAHACSACHYFVGWAAQGTAAECGRQGYSRVRATPETGCSGWEREPGADDEPIPRPSHPCEPWLSWQAISLRRQDPPE